MRKALVYQTDFGTSDGAVSAMYGVALKVDPELDIYDLTHDIPQYNIWEASYRLVQTVRYWPEGTVFVSVVDPGVGSDRRSIAALTEGDQIIVSPDNGTLTHIKLLFGIKELRLVDETKNRLSGSELSYTFHGRDVYAYTGARLASGKLRFEDVGELVPIDTMVCLPHLNAEKQGDIVFGNIDALDVRFGSLWTNIPYKLFSELGIDYGKRVELSIRNETREVYRNTMVYARSFADVALGEPLVYVNSILNMAVAINQGSFAKAYDIGTGISWKLSLRKAPRIIYE